MACAKQLKPFEQMLFDHCMYYFLPLRGHSRGADGVCLL